MVITIHYIMHPSSPEHITIPVHIMERHDIITHFRTNAITLNEACAQCNLSERQIYRLVATVKEKGIEGLMHGNTGRVSNRAITPEKKAEIEKYVRASYHDFGPTFASEKLHEDHALTVSVETLRTFMMEWGLWKPKPRRGNREHRAWRERRALFGELIQFDGCYHKWFEDRAPSCCLLVAVDDATGRITGLLFTDWEGVFPSFAFWNEYLDTHGKPRAIYLDKHSTYKVNAKTLIEDTEARSQFGRACEELDITLIHAHSPEAKGRVERLNDTLQDRLVKELRLQCISDRTTANRFLREKFIPAFNAKFAVVAREEGDAHRPLTECDRVSRERVFSIRTERTVMNDFTIRYKGRYFQLEKTTLRLVCRKEKVEVEERVDGTIRIHLRGAYLPMHELPERPQKVRDTKNAPVLLAHVKSPWKPAKDHPWRRGVAHEKHDAVELLK